MPIDESVLFDSEKYVLQLRSLYTASGYCRYRMSKFEEYDLYMKHKDFLLSDSVLTFTDTNGRLMALKPDVTLSIIKNSEDRPDETTRLCYNESVYRVDRGSGSFGESMQCGLECFGKVGAAEAAEVILLAAGSLDLFSDDWVLAVSDLDTLAGIVRRRGLRESSLPALFKAIGERSAEGIAAACEEGGDPGAAAEFSALLGAGCSVAEAAEKLRGICGESFAGIAGILAKSRYADRIRVDFSVTADMNYYNGLIFNGFVPGIPEEVLSGGMYANLMRRLGRRSDAIGFAVYTDRLDRICDSPVTADGSLTVALPKGRLGEKVYARFAAAGFDCPPIDENSRKLISENGDGTLKFFWVKPSDVSKYVERGAADIGVCGKDILLDYSPDVYELLDLDTGKCRMAVAAPRGFTYPAGETLRVATKFPNIAKRHFASKGMDIDIIHLNGSIELAPIVGLSDVIVDIVETGTTLKENDLEVVEKICDISARLIANKSSFFFKEKAMLAALSALREASV
jgi:ATP phosphoribosyltransferase regulatory subunit